VIAHGGIACPITVFGAWDGPPPPAGIRVLGSYELSELPQLIQNSGANVFLLPSIVPETFSFVCEELMHLGVPLVVFDIGAPPERVASYSRGLVVHYVSPDDLLARLIAFHTDLAARESAS